MDGEAEEFERMDRERHRLREEERDSTKEWQCLHLKTTKERRIFLISMVFEQ